ncbi:MAG: hypothetical protein R3D58_13615 [Saprospiraceae bacterium]
MIKNLKSRWGAFFTALTILAAAGLLVSTMAATTFQAPATKGNGLRELLEQLIQITVRKPDEKGLSWKKWLVVDKHWNTVLAVASSQDKTKADMLCAMRDSVPLIALLSPGQKGRFDFVKIDRDLCNGWEVSARAFTAQKGIDWVELKNAEGTIFVIGDGDARLPQFLAMPIEDNTHWLILGWNKFGDEFESILFYDLRQRAITTFSDFALHPGAMRFVFLKAADNAWLEFSYSPGQKAPTGVAVHHQEPGRLMAAFMDLNKDGKMDTVAEIAADKNQLGVKKSDAPLESPDNDRINELKTYLVDKAVLANHIWLDAQALWRQLEPLGVPLPERFNM